MKVSELKQLALLKLQKQVPKTKKELEAFVLGESSSASASAPKTLSKETAKEVKEVQEHLKKKNCPKVKPEELEGMQSHKEAVSHLKKKKCPETEAVAKKSYVAPAPEKPDTPVTKSGRPKKEYTEEQKAANREKMAKLRAMRGKAKKDSEPESDYVY